MKYGRLDRCPSCGAYLPEITIRLNELDESKSKITTRFAERICPDCKKVAPPMTGQMNAVRVYPHDVETKKDDAGFTHPNLHRRINWCQCYDEWICPTHKDIGPCDCSPGVECKCAIIRLNYDRAQCSAPRELIKRLVGTIWFSPIDRDSYYLKNEEEKVLLDERDGAIFFPAVAVFLDENKQPINDVDPNKPPTNWAIGGGDSQEVMIHDNEFECSDCFECNRFNPNTGECALCIDFVEDRYGRNSDRRRPNESYKVGIYSHNSYLTTEVHTHDEEHTEFMEHP